MIILWKHLRWGVFIYKDDIFHVITKIFNEIIMFACYQFDCYDLII